MKRILAFIIISFGFFTISTTSVKAVNPIIAIEGIGLGLQILEKGIEKIGGGKKSNSYSSNNSNYKKTNISTRSNVNDYPSLEGAQMEIELYRYSGGSSVRFKEHVYFKSYNNCYVENRAGSCSYSQSGSNFTLRFLIGEGGEKSLSGNLYKLSHKVDGRYRDKKGRSGSFKGAISPIKYVSNHKIKSSAEVKSNTNRTFNVYTYDYNQDQFFKGASKNSMEAAEQISKRLCLQNSVSSCQIHSRQIRTGNVDGPILKTGYFAGKKPTSFNTYLVNIQKFKKVTNELSPGSNFKGYTWNGYIVSKDYYCNEALKAGMQNWGRELFNKKGCSDKLLIAKNSNQNSNTNKNNLFNGVYKWNGKVVTKSYFCNRANNNSMHIYFPDKYKVMCGKNNIQVAKSEPKQNENKPLICVGNGNVKYIYKFREKQRCENNSAFTVITKNHSMYDWFASRITNSSKKNTQVTKSEPKQNNELAFCLSKIKESNAFVVRNLDTNPCDGDNIIVTNNNVEDLNLFNNLKDRFESADGALIVTNEQINKFSNNKNIKLASKKKQEEFKPLDGEEDNDPPVIKIAKNITVKDSSYVIEGKLLDKSKKLFVEVDGKILPAKDGKFKIPRFSPINESVKIVAIDQWGNRSKPKIVNIKIDLQDTKMAQSLEPLDPSKMRTTQNINRVALIIGIENYEQTPDATYANLDAKYFYEYARKGFGVPKSNIKLLVDEDASLISSLGTINKWLPSKVNKNRTELFVFFAGHGLASNDGRELYILPQDSDPDLLSRTALSRNELFTAILNLNPKSVTMFFDTCFSGISRDEKILLASARPIRIIADEQEGTPDNFTIFSASQLNQISSGLKEANHGIFSYFLMKGLEGNADTNKDRKITNGELIAYMDQNVSIKASELGRQQNPSLTGDPNKILLRY